MSAAPPIEAPPSSAPLGPMSAAPPNEAGAASLPSAVAEVQQPLAPLAKLAEDRILGRLLQLGRDIRRERTYVGHSAFLLFALIYQCRPFIWEGSSRIDLIEVLAPWAKERCTRSCVVDGVCCCFERMDKGGAVMVPVSETHPLATCRHYVAGARIDLDDPGHCPGDGDSLQSFYYHFGLALLGTVMDGDCGIDVCVQMLGQPQNKDTRIALREENDM